MNLKQTRWLLRLLTAACLVAALAVVYWGMFPTSPPSGDDASAGFRRPPVKAARLADLPPLADFERLWDLRLQGAPPASAAEPRQDQIVQPARSAVVTPQISLLGTILEAGGRSRAVFRGPGGEIDLKGVGEELELAPAGIRVEEIRLASVRLSYRGESMTLELPPGEAP